jgi:hypothetical protein
MLDASPTQRLAASEKSRAGKNPIFFAEAIGFLV